MILLDTCTLLWLASDVDKLSATARRLLGEQADALFVSAITAFEIGIKVRSGKLTLHFPVTEWLPRALALKGIGEIPVDGAIAAASTQLPPLHNDPCDRLIVATARHKNLTVLTPDRLVCAYDVRTAW